ncbi:sulfotransferase family 2 domain-containing protein [Pseudalkalibacillus salsuginis]|uniref:sulfotransferase family 2 domain-containing protein n=1 Tax=Pseudalkalibacillus salsuginis TaxID=2910972 RepID=UPI001F3CC297|nr:sulfotransferase family 2 domain-containing protein [Pseudalkalibacillus salsuginis]MCF6409084.1 sulfotransferase family protein [Pseudalkalibacillus salsuginis]
MIISHKYKFIFLKTKKTAGTSIEISLSRYCGDKDIITPIMFEDEKIRADLGKYPQNYQIGQINFYNHDSANKIKSLIGEDIWDSYYKFCFDRNPWDKVISLYYFLVKDPKKESFDEFLERKGYKYAYNFPIYTINNKSVVDYLGKYENLESDLKSICNKISLPFDGWLPNAKGNFRKNHQHYSTQYNKHQREVIHNFFKKEIELLNYKF